MPVKEACFSDQYDKAIELLKQAIAADDQFAEAHNQLGNIYFAKHQYPEAYVELTRSVVLNPNYSRMVYFNLGQTDIMLAKYTEAKTVLQKYLEYNEVLSKDRATAQKLLLDCDFSLQAVQHPVDFKPVNLGTSINSAADEYLPNVTADESTLIFYAENW